MSWAHRRKTARERYVAKYDAHEAAAYDAYVGTLSAADEAAYLSDMQQVFSFRRGMQILDAGAGSGTLSKVLLQAVPGLALTALEPSAAMLALLRSKLELTSVHCVQGFCDATEDRAQFAADQFDVIASRQLVNGLYDPLVAFDNWFHWLKSGGSIVAIDGFYGRAAWTKMFEEEVDLLPLSACQSMATLPYLLEKAGFEIQSVNLMSETNKMPATRTTRYIIVATKP
jgi:ubiquinone/menaquinone biosynthesis C-methylase UbiE